MQEAPLRIFITLCVAGLCAATGVAQPVSGAIGARVLKAAMKAYDAFGGRTHFEAHEDSSSRHLLDLPAAKD